MGGLTERLEARKNHSAENLVVSDSPVS